MTTYKPLLIATYNPYNTRFKTLLKPKEDEGDPIYEA
jgi:hypothetical protein